MSEGPYPDPPRITGPVLGITGASAIGKEQNRQKQRKKDDKEAPATEDQAPESLSELPPPLASPLIEALDRLRTTDAERSSETDVIRLLRARRIYQGDS